MFRSETGHAGNPSSAQRMGPVGKCSRHSLTQCRPVLAAILVSQQRITNKCDVYVLVPATFVCVLVIHERATFILYSTMSGFSA